MSAPPIASRVFLYESRHVSLAPLDLLRHQGDLLCGALTNAERVERLTGVTPHRLARPRAGAALLPNPPALGAGLYVPAHAVLRAPLAVEGPPEAGMVGDRIAWMRLDEAGAARFARGEEEALAGLPRRDFQGAILLERPWDLVCHLPDLLAADAALLLPRRSASSARIHSTAVIDESGGPVVVCDDAVLEPLSVIQGPAFIGPGAVVRAHAHIRGSVLGRGCRVGGEVSASIFHPWSNKQHFGFLGHSVVGSWVNIGAGATGSNLKNTYGEIRVAGVGTGLHYLGQIIGDHAKIGIQAAMNTGSVYGIASSIVAGPGPLPKRIPDFDFVGVPAALEPLLATIRTVMGRRDQVLDASTESVLRALHAAATSGGTPAA